MNIREAIIKLMEREHLSDVEAEQVMLEIMGGGATPAQIGSFLTALRLNGETVDEIAGCARAMRANAVTVRPQHRLIVDTCGTGGDGANTFNISTTAAFVVAGAGLPVAKHGNRSVSSRSGSADVLGALDVQIDISPAHIADCIDEIGIGFLFAPALHPAMKHAVGPRRELGIRTIFNILGPLCNPAGARRQLLGVYDGSLTVVLGAVLQRLGTGGAIVVHGNDGLDELSTTGANVVTRVTPTAIETTIFDPTSIGVRRANLSDLAGGTPEDNAGILRSILEGERGPRRDIVLLNAAAALVAGGKATAFRKGLSIAADAIDSGHALEKLERLITFTNS
jgi:anthranilate phosphoribosyltransferase